MEAMCSKIISENIYPTRLLASRRVLTSGSIWIVLLPFATLVGNYAGQAGHFCVVECLVDTAV